MECCNLKHPNSFNVSLFVNNLLISDYTDRQRVYADDEGNIIYQTVGNEKALYMDKRKVQKDY